MGTYCVCILTGVCKLVSVQLSTFSEGLKEIGPKSQRQLHTCLHHAITCQSHLIDCDNAETTKKFSLRRHLTVYLLLTSNSQQKAIPRLLGALIRGELIQAMFKGMFWTQPFSRNKEMTEAVFGEVFVCFQITWTLGGGWRWIAQVEETPVRDPGWRSQVDSPGVDPLVQPQTQPQSEAASCGKGWGTVTNRAFLSARVLTPW